MNLVPVILKLVLGIVPMIFDSVPPPDPERRERRDAMRAKRQWWIHRRRLHVAQDKNAPIQRILRIRASLAKWEEALERLDENVEVEEMAFKLLLERTA
tara:strand:+ start:850 stop:1146 length:297 start_codon:yes stop_codon:yes gene_type:complete